MNNFLNNLNKIKLTFINKLKLNWIKIIIFLIIIFICIGFILKIIFNVNTSDNLILSFFCNINTFIYIYTLKYLLLIYMLFSVLITLLEYILYKYYYEITIKNVPKYLPKLLKEQIMFFNLKTHNTELKNLYVAKNRRLFILALITNSLGIYLLLHI